MHPLLEKLQTEKTLLPLLSLVLGPCFQSFFMELFHLESKVSRCATVQSVYMWTILIVRGQALGQSRDSLCKAQIQCCTGQSMHCPDPHFVHIYTLYIWVVVSMDNTCTVYTAWDWVWHLKCSHMVSSWGTDRVRDFASRCRSQLQNNLGSVAWSTTPSLFHRMSWQINLTCIVSMDWQSNK